MKEKVTDVKGRAYADAHPTLTHISYPYAYNYVQFLQACQVTVCLCWHMQDYCLGSLIL